VIPKEQPFFFSFLFACPLVSGTLTSGKKLQVEEEFMRLDSATEFNLIKQTVTEAQAQVCIQKKHGTVTNFSEQICRGPQAIHFSGHGSE